MEGRDINVRNVHTCFEILYYLILIQISAKTFAQIGKKNGKKLVKKTTLVIGGVKM